MWQNPEEQNTYLHHTEILRSLLSMTVLRLRMCHVTFTSMPDIT
jgi:hypothetical protein